MSAAVMDAIEASKSADGMPTPLPADSGSGGGSGGGGADVGVGPSTDASADSVDDSDAATSLEPAPAPALAAPPSFDVQNESCAPPDTNRARFGCHRTDCTGPVLPVEREKAKYKCKA